MILLAGFYEDKDARRLGELLDCLRRNLENVWLDEIHLFVEEPVALHELVSRHKLLASAKVRLIEHGRRVTYRDMFAYANSRLRGRRVIIANADIFFDHTLARLDGYDLSGKLLCLSRWDVQADGSACFFDHPSSQDAWVFQAPIREFPCDFHLGLPGCDNRLAWEAGQAGLRLSNPSRSLRAYHLHLSRIHRYHERQRLTGPTRDVPAGFLDAPDSRAVEQQEMNRAVHAAYRRAKSAILEETGGNSISRSTLRELYNAGSRRHLIARGLSPEAPCASVAFRETMGYTVARLEAGVSSHNNDPRPFKMIPEPLAGLQFTQVVSSIVSPVEVEFLTPGKLYVLVGNDWDGSQTAKAWLCQTGFREGLPPLETRRGNGFEVWSLVGEAGETFVLPTQVMLAAERLVRK
jgi:hypothetical protein